MACFVKPFSGTSATLSGSQTNAINDAHIFNKVEIVAHASISAFQNEMQSFNQRIFENAGQIKEAFAQYAKKLAALKFEILQSLGEKHEITQELTARVFSAHFETLSEESLLQEAEPRYCRFIQNEMTYFNELSSRLSK